MAQLSISKVRQDQPLRRFVIVTEESYNDDGIAAGGTNRGLIAIDPAKCPRTPEQEEEFLRNLDNKYDFALGSDEQAGSPGWFTVMTFPKGAAKPAAAGQTTHTEASEVVESETEQETA